jgi:hypothetical protein
MYNKYIQSDDTKNKMSIYLLKFKKALRIATEIIPKLPTKEDGLLNIAIKSLGIWDSVSSFAVGHHLNELDTFLQNLPNKVNHDNGQFVTLFFQTELKDLFKLQTIPLHAHLSIVKAKNNTLGELYFVQDYNLGKTKHWQTFWSKPGTDLNKILYMLWQEFNGKIHVGFTNNENFMIVPVYSKIPNNKDQILGEALNKLNKFTEQHLSYVRDGLQRTYLFYGKQGSGKSSFAVRLAELTHGNILRIDANGMTSINNSEFDLLINSLRPDFLIIDDIDRASDLKKCLPTLFTILTDFKTKHSNVTIIMTINDLSVMDVALLRPGRIDEIIEFELPNLEDRKTILLGFLREFNIDCLYVDQIAEMTDGLTAAYLKEIAIQLKYKSHEYILTTVKQMIMISNQLKNNQ